MKIALVCFALLIAIFTSTVCAEIRIIAHRSVLLNVIKKGEVTNIFLGKTTHWENGDKIVPVILRSGPAHEAFLKDVVGKTSAQFSTYWKQYAFWGKGREPKSFDNEADLVKYVSETRGAVGYADESAVNRNVKVLTAE
jgi:ABC-type phosphate transport system substrate-binding protein